MKVKFILILISFVFIFQNINAQNNEKIYNPEADSKAEIQVAVKQAKAENKHVFIQIGGDWCSWCVKMHEFYTSDTEIDSIMNADYVRLLVYYNRREKINEDLMKELGFPQRFGFPVLVILDENGVRLHTQDSRYLEAGEEYNRKYFINFLFDWNKQAVNPENYK